VGHAPGASARFWICRLSAITSGNTKPPLQWPLARLSWPWEEAVPISSHRSPTLGTPQLWVAPAWPAAQSLVVLAPPGAPNPLSGTRWCGVGPGEGGLGTVLSGHLSHPL
jgi:hypothetical protein